MGGSEPKTKKAAPATATSSFDNIDEFNVGFDGFGSSASSRSPLLDASGNPTGKFQLNTQAKLDPNLKPNYDLGVSGLQNAQSVLNTPLADRVASIDKDPYYQQLNEILNRNLKSNLSDVTANFASNGLENSTVRGALTESALNDDHLKRLAGINEALDYQSNNALQSGAFQSGILSQLAGFQSAPAEMGNNNLMTGFQSKDNIAQSNAANITQANMANAQAANQAAMMKAQSRSSMIGNLVGAGLSLASMPFTAGLSGMSVLGAMKNGLGAAAPTTAASFVKRGVG